MKEVSASHLPVPPPVLQAQSFVCLRDDAPLFRPVDFVLSAGGVLQISGENGAGKTTLLRALAGLYSLFEGEIFWRSQLVREDASLFHQEKLFLGHDLALKLTATPLENLEWWWAVAHGFTGLPSENNSCDFSVQKTQVHSRQEIQINCQKALAAVGLSLYEDVSCVSLSAGQKRRVSLARLLISSAVLWVLDEPFTNLDRAGVDWVEVAIQSHQAKGGMVIFSSHQVIHSFSVNTLLLESIRSGGR